MAEGRSNVAIAEELVVSAGAVEKHVRNIFTKLGVSSRTAAVSVARERGILR